MDLVEKVLLEAAEKEAKFQTTEVQKAIDVEIDEGNLLSIDTNPLEIHSFRENKETFLLNLARDNTQLLLNKLFQLPTERVDDVIVAKLGDPKTLVPREKPVPKTKPPTKWEQYARLKGIQNKKRSRMMWDEKTKEWKPRWGYKRANDETKEWLLEVPDNRDPFEDQFSRKKKEKAERVSKNEYQRLKNIARAQKVKLPNMGVTPTNNPSKTEVNKALSLAKISTASLGKFTESLPKEKKTKYSGKKRKFEENHGNIRTESEKQLQILNRITNKLPVVDISKTSAMHNASSSAKRSNSKSDGKFKKTFKPKGKGGHGKFSGKGKGGGKKAGGKQFGGRKGKP